MPERVELRVDGRPLAVDAGVSLAAALLNSGQWRFRTSVGGEPRGALCAIGVCYECRVTIDGVPHQRACMVACAAGMDVATGG